MKCNQCKHDGKQSIFRSGCTGCCVNGGFDNFEQIDNDVAIISECIQDIVAIGYLLMEVEIKKKKGEAVCTVSYIHNKSGYEINFIDYAVKLLKKTKLERMA